MKPGERFQIGEGTSLAFPRESRDRRPFPETDRPYTTRAELIVYIACACAIASLVLVFAFEYLSKGHL